MKAFLLAAGEGTRLKPLTNHVPKCLVPIGGRPLLEIWLERLAQHGVGEVLVNTHHLASNVWDFAERWTGLPKIRLTFEPELLGSAGTLRWNRDFVAGEEDFLVCYADNLTDIDIGRLVGFHRSRRALITMALFRSIRPAECGIVELDDAGRVTGYEEKLPIRNRAWRTVASMLCTPASFPSYLLKPFQISVMTCCHNAWARCMASSGTAF